MRLLASLSFFLVVFSHLIAEERPSSLISKHDKMTIKQLIVPGFENLPLKRKLFVYHLVEAFEAGKEISWKQNSKYGVQIRDLLLSIWEHKNAFPVVQKAMLEEYLSQVLSNLGNYQKLGNEKIVPDFLDKENLQNMAALADALNKRKGINTHLLDKSLTLESDIFSRDYKAKKMGQGERKLQDTQTNYYGDVTVEEVKSMNIPGDDLFFSYPDKDDQNNLIIRKNKIGDRFSEDLSLISEKIKLALNYANKSEKEILSAHLKVMETGSYEDFLKMNRLWVKSNSADIDFMFGFIEVYNDPLEQRGAWQGFITIKNLDDESVRRSKVIEKSAYEFESKMPVESRFKKEPGFTPPKSEGVNFAYTGGLFELIAFNGINLPNDQSVRENYGSKSFTMVNLRSNHGQTQEEKNLEVDNSVFIPQEYKELYKEVDLSLISMLKTEFHEILGHGSGKYVNGATQLDLKDLYLAFEEGRAEVAALYHITDPNLYDSKILPLDYSIEKVKQSVIAAIIEFFTNQIRSYERLSDETTEIKQAHQLGRQIIFNNLLKERVLEIKISQNNIPHVYIVNNDITRVRSVLGKVWAKIQKVISTGDYENAQKIIENEGFYNDTHKHWRSLVLKAETLGIDDYFVIDKKITRLTAYLNPKYSLIKDETGAVRDVRINYYSKGNGPEQLIDSQHKAIKKCQKLLSI